MFKERLIKYKQLKKESSELYCKTEKERALLERIIEKYRKEHIKPLKDKTEQTYREMRTIQHSIEKEFRDSLIEFGKHGFEQDLKMEAIKLLTMLEEYSEIQEFLKSVPIARTVVPLMEYFLEIEDVDLCMRTLKSWHKLDVGYSYDQLADRYFAMIDDFSKIDKSFKIGEKSFEAWKHHVYITPNLGVPQEFEMYKMIELLGRLDARHAQSEEKTYYSERSKKAIIYASIGGFSRIIKDDGYIYLIEPYEWMERAMPWVEKYRQCLIKAHDEAYLAEKELLKAKEKQEIIGGKKL